MKIVEPSVELWKQGDIEEYDFHIARCARVCYKSDKVDGNKQLVERLIESKHYSVFRHWTFYCIIPLEEFSDEYDPRELAFSCNNHIGFDCQIELHNFNLLVVYNGHWALEHPKEHDIFVPYRVSPNEFENSCQEAFDMMRYTFCVTTQISTSRELNRVSPNNITEESTRYVTEGEICRPHWLDKKSNFNDKRSRRYIQSCIVSFKNYNDLIACGLSRQDARGVLPIDTKTTVAYTYSAPEWEHIIRNRYYGDTGAPHPNAKIIAGMIKDKLNELGYDL